MEPSEAQKVASAVPARAFVAPRRPRKLLIFDLNVGYGGHDSIRTANLAFELMGRKTGAFDTVVSRDPSVFAPESLRRFDAVFLNNTVGNLFEDAALRQSLIEFVYGGGGLMGVHGTSVAFTRWPGAHEDWEEFGLLLGARGANHRDSDERVFIKLDDPTHPINQPFGGQGFEYRDEFFRFHDAYSRNRVRVLLSIDTDKTTFAGQPRGDCIREDNDYALAWVRQYGRGRVFYSTIAHNPYVFWDPKMLEFYLAATQFVLGDLPVPTLPSAKLTPAARAQEQLGWRLGITARPGAKQTLFESIERAAALGLLYVGALSVSAVSQDTRRSFDHQLAEADLRQVRLKLDAAAVRLLTYEVGTMPAQEDDRRRLFEFGRKMGIEAIVADPQSEGLEAIEELCTEYDIRLAVNSHPLSAGAAEQRPEGLLRLCTGRSQAIGVCADLGAWQRAGIDPIKAVRVLGDRLIIARLDGLDGSTNRTPETPSSHETAPLAQVLAEMHHWGIRPIMFDIGRVDELTGEDSGILRRMETFNRTNLRLQLRPQTTHP